MPVPCIRHEIAFGTVRVTSSVPYTSMARTCRLPTQTSTGPRPTSMAHGSMLTYRRGQARLRPSKSRVLTMERVNLRRKSFARAHVASAVTSWLVHSPAMAYMTWAMPLIALL